MRMGCEEGDCQEVDRKKEGQGGVQRLMRGGKEVNSSRVEDDETGKEEGRGGRAKSKEISTSVCTVEREEREGRRGPRNSPWRKDCSEEWCSWIG
jgi:hypothetical protein